MPKLEIKHLSTNEFMPASADKDFMKGIYKLGFISDHEHLEVVIKREASKQYDYLKTLSADYFKVNGREIRTVKVWRQGD